MLLLIMGGLALVSFYSFLESDELGVVVLTVVNSVFCPYGFGAGAYAY